MKAYPFAAHSAAHCSMMSWCELPTSSSGMISAEFDQDCRSTKCGASKTPADGELTARRLVAGSTLDRSVGTCMSMLSWSAQHPLYSRSDQRGFDMGSLRVAFQLGPGTQVDESRHDPATMNG